MGKDAISQSKAKESSTSESVNSSPIILIIAVISIIAVGLFLFKDKIFKKKSNDKPKEFQKVEEPDDSQDEGSEILQEPEAREINEKFEKLDD